MVKKKILEQEFASAKKEWGYFNKYKKTIDNPDPILRKTKEGIEKGISLFSEMKKDSHISAVLQKRKRAVLKYYFNIESASGKRYDKKVAEFIKEEIKKVYYNLASYILDAIPMGFSITEIIYKVEDKIKIDKIKKRKQNRFTFGIDGELRLKTPESMLEGEELPDKKFIVATYEEEDDNKYGEAVLSNCFWPWWFKKHGLLFWANFLEKFGQPLTVGKYPAGTPKDKQEAFLESIEAIQNSFGIVIPESFVIDFIEAQKSSSTDSYQKFLDYLDRQISKAVLSSTLAVDEAQHGTRAQAEVHNEVSEEVIEADIRFLESIINNTILKWLVEFNFGDVSLPTFSIDFKNDKATKTDIDKLKTLYDMGVKIPVKYIYDITKIPEPEADEEVVFGGKSKINENPDISNMKIEFSEGENNYLDDIVDKYFESFKKSIKEKQIYDVVKVLKKAKDYKDALKKLDKVKYNIDFNKVILLGKLIGKYYKYDNKGKEFADNKISDDEMNKVFEELFHSVKPEKAIEYLKKKIPVDKETWKKLSDEAKASAFYINNTSKLVLINSIKEKLLQAIEKGMTYTEVKKDIINIYNKVKKNFNESYIKTVFYTNIYSVINAERYKTIMDDEYTEWLTYYTANDDRVRPNHQALHGFTARKDDPIWDSIWPPNGFNCRCIVRRSNSEGKYPAKAPAEPDEGFSYNPAKADREKLVQALSKNEKYKEYLDKAIESWIGLDRPSLDEIDISSLPIAPNKLRPGKNFEYYWEALEKYLNQKGDILIIKLKDELSKIIGIDKVTVNKEFSLKHIVDYKPKQGREQYILYAIETLNKPFEIWEFKQSGKTAQYRFIGVFNDNKEKVSVVVIINLEKDNVMWSMNITKKSDFMNRRRGRFLYGK